MPTRPLSLPLVIGALLPLGGCAPTPPARWVQGGAMLVLPHAHYSSDERTIEITPQGAVHVDGDALYLLDRAGRVTDLDGDPVALLEPDGRLVGPDDRSLGRVGVLHAAPPGSPHAWLSVGPAGEVIRYGDDGERQHEGSWRGCHAPPARLACTLVSHLVLLREHAAPRRSGVSFGIGAGMIVR